MSSLQPEAESYQSTVVYNWSSTRKRLIYNQRLNLIRVLWYIIGVVREKA